MPIFEGIQAAGVDDPTAVSAKLAGRRFAGLMGPLAFDAQHNPQKAMVVMRVDSSGVRFSTEVQYFLPLVPRIYLPLLQA